MAGNRGSGCGATCYQIIVQGRVDASWGDWFNRMELLPYVQPDGSWLTSLTGDVVDQPALRGVLTRLWDLNLTVVSVRVVGRGRRCSKRRRRDTVAASD